MKKIEVVAAILTNENEILCAQRGPSKFDYISCKYEFPGGKIEDGETKEEAIIREIKEELHLEISNPQYYMTVEFQYPDFFITMHAFFCPINHRNVTLAEHINIQWLGTNELGVLDWAAADVPIVTCIVEQNGF